MTEIALASAALPSTTKQPETVHPYYFNSFQNYCCGPKGKSTSSPSSREHLPIPERFKLHADEILHSINNMLIENLSQVTQYTSVLSHEFFDRNDLIEYQRYLIDRTMFKVMVETQIINWVPSLKKLYPVRTSGNGNCLLHAVLIAMVGVHDFHLYLRDRLRQFMDKNKATLKENWKIERIKNDKIYGIQSEDSKLDSEWEELCDLVRYGNSDDGTAVSSFEFLESVHIFSISNMLLRPIIILSEDVVRNKHGEAIGYNDLFGIYLPTLSKPDECTLVPIVLAYDQSHFCPLQTNDSNTGTTQDNYLPLYQSIEHIRNQNLLPIRFLGADTKAEQKHSLLEKYLTIKKLAYYPNSKGSSIPIVCAQLGNKRIPKQDDFLFLYHEYVLDCIELQKGRRNNKDDVQRRDQEYYASAQSISDTNQRLLTQHNNSSPPPSYASVTARLNDNKNLINLERRPSYDKAVANGTSYAPSNDENRRLEVQQSQKLQNYPYVNGTTNTNSHNHPLPGKFQNQKSNWDSNDDDLMSNGKTPTNSNNNNNPRGIDSKLKQGQHHNFTQIPVNYITSDLSTPDFIQFEPKPIQYRICAGCRNYTNASPSNGLCSDCDSHRKHTLPHRFKSDSTSTNLIDFEQETDKLRPCIVCKHYFYDLSSIGLCSECDKRNPMTYRPVTPIRTSSMVVHPATLYRNSDFLTPISTIPRLKGAQKIYCPKCKKLNILNGITAGTYKCSICQANLSVPL